MKSLKVKKENGICWVYLSRPDSMNALNKELLEELTEFNNNLKNDLETKVVIYSGDGENFSAGADIKEKNSSVKALAFQLYENNGVLKREKVNEYLKNLEQNKIVNDELYSDSKARMYLRRGYSLNKINQSLRSKGKDEKFVKQSLEKIKENQIEPDFVSALKLCKRRRIGPLRPESNRELFYKKDMGILARGGFSFDLSKRVLDLDANEFKKLIKII